MEVAQVYISIRVDKTTMGNLHNGVPLGDKKEENFTICDSMDGPGEQIPCDFAHIWKLMNKLN